MLKMDRKMKPLTDKVADYSAKTVHTYMCAY